MMPERLPLDPAVRELIDQQAKTAAQFPPPKNEGELVAMRRELMVRALATRTGIPGLPNAVTSREVEIRQGLNARLFFPKGSSDGAPWPVLVYLHGGGWVVGSVALFDPFCRLLSEAAGVIILSVDYRLAPEHPYPAALEDTLAAYDWAQAHAAEWGGDPLRLGLAGDSAGGGLAAVAATRICHAEKAATRICRAEKAAALIVLLLLYPVADHPEAGHPSYREYAVGYGLEAQLMRWFVRQYAGDVSPQDESVFALQTQNIPPLPPTLITTAEYDVLRDEGIAYAEKLRTAGIRVTHLHSPDMSHNFVATPAMVGRFPQAVATLTEIAAWLKRTLSVAAL